VDAYQTIRNCPGIFERMRQSMMGHVEEYTESHGGHLEHVLFQLLQIICLRPHAIMDVFLDFVCETHARILFTLFSNILYTYKVTKDEQLEF
jgi:hypothetical protein